LQRPLLKTDYISQFHFGNTVFELLAAQKCRQRPFSWFSQVWENQETGFLLQKSEAAKGGLGTEFLGPRPPCLQVSAVYCQQVNLRPNLGAVLHAPWGASTQRVPIHRYPRVQIARRNVIYTKRGRTRGYVNLGQLRRHPLMSLLSCEEKRGRKRGRKYHFSDSQCRSIPWRLLGPGRPPQAGPAPPLGPSQPASRPFGWPTARHPGSDRRTAGWSRPRLLLYTIRFFFYCFCLPHRFHLVRIHPLKWQSHGMAPRQGEAGRQGGPLRQAQSHPRDHNETSLFKCIMTACKTLAYSGAGSAPVHFHRIRSRLVKMRRLTAPQMHSVQIGTVTLTCPFKSTRRINNII